MSLFPCIDAPQRIRESGRSILDLHRQVLDGAHGCAGVAIAKVFQLNRDAAECLGDRAKLCVVNLRQFPDSRGQIISLRGCHV